jgi:hypothetical protein
VGGVLGDPRLALAEIDVDVQAAGLGVQAHDVAVAQASQRAARGGLRRAVDRRGDLARRARHAAVGDERDAEPAVHQHAERRGELVQLRHPVRARTLVADHGDVVKVEVTAIERGEEVQLVVEDARGRGHDAMLGGDGGDLHHRAAERALEHADAAVGRERVADGAQAAFIARLPVGRTPRELAGVVEVRLVAIAAEAVAGDGLDARVHEAVI